MSELLSGESIEHAVFAGEQLLLTGGLVEVATEARRFHLEQPDVEVLIFDEATGKTVDLDLRCMPEELTAQLRHLIKPTASEDEAETVRGRGRPRLGVVPREVTLLPRHWEWLGEQPGGASVTLRKLVEEAKKANAGRDAKRKAQEACYRFMTTMAGDRAGFEEANRALFAGNREKFELEIAGWPEDVRGMALKIGEVAFAPCN
ncbi:DUF2239 family protein [Phragmitibacter flavus]|uniref:DUF2239 family protein n=1 Tax=Phragmitibacter flavus TaxID=2576071 RepID=A0A5R8KLJ3_9BACT|nr:DUF2239 family protein [Phragmitibacter flavus]TLD72599.1 DUF2239 family protein [Phragmitibacter flavus]